MSDTRYASTASHPEAVPPLLGILRLPLQIRARIYKHCKLYRDNYKIHLKLKKRQLPRDSEDEIRRRIVIRLFLTCRTIYSEASHLMFANSNVSIDYEIAQSLDRLRCFSVASISSLTELTFNLYAITCGETIPACLDCAYPGREMPCHFTGQVPALRPGMSPLRLRNGQHSVKLSSLP